MNDVVRENDVEHAPVPPFLRARAVQKHQLLGVAADRRRREPRGAKAPVRTETARCRTACVRTPRARRAPGRPTTRARARRPPGARRKRPRRAARPPRRRARTRAAACPRETRETLAGKNRRRRRRAVALHLLPRLPKSPTSRLPSPRRAAGSTRTARRTGTRGPARARRAPPGPTPAFEAACAAASARKRDPIPRTHPSKRICSWSVSSLRENQGVPRIFSIRDDDGLMTRGNRRSESDSSFSDADASLAHIHPHGRGDAVEGP